MMTIDLIILVLQTALIQQSMWKGYVPRFGSACGMVIVDGHEHSCLSIQVDHHLHSYFHHLYHHVEGLYARSHDLTNTVNMFGGTFGTKSQ